MYMLVPRGNPPAVQGTRPAVDGTGTFVRAAAGLRRSCRACCLVLLVTLGFCLFAAPTHAAPVSVILDTDIGDDIDDTWALAMLLGMPQLDLKLVVTDYGNTPEPGSSRKSSNTPAAQTFPLAQG